MEARAFRKIILDNYRERGRDFPWRKEISPWGVLVSEFMLQQTQTGRVVSYWERWMKRWPGPGDLAAAPLDLVLREWSGLGYNRRAKKLWECAGVIEARHGGEVPRTPELLITLPGIGPYTSGAVACFAWNYPAVFIETNIRSTLLHFFFQDREGVKDDELFPLLRQVLDAENPRIWYWALMDYGAELKKLTANPGRKSAHYTRQSRFEGSFRQIRGQIVKNLAGQGGRSPEALRAAVAAELPEMKEGDFYRALAVLEKEMMVAEDGGLYRIKS
ncbi:MAG: A/G-specific adenine glycosylase [Treponema sp.]|nr:A/G-specific adenine glycosylase [Treponema sp.]